MRISRVFAKCPPNLLGYCPHSSGVTMATSAQIHRRPPASNSSGKNPLPALIQTPSGLAVLELQGTINLPGADDEVVDGGPDRAIPIGTISFRDRDADDPDRSDTSWMKEVHLHVGQHQRLTGEVRKLPRALAVVRRRAGTGEDEVMSDDAAAEPTVQDLELVDIVKYKLVFSQRPEPVASG